MRKGIKGREGKELEGKQRNGKGRRGKERKGKGNEGKGGKVASSLGTHRWLQDMNEKEKDRRGKEGGSLSTHK